MPKLEHLYKGMQNVKRDLDDADSMKSNADEFLGKRFDESDKRMDASLKNVMKEQSEQAVFASAVHQTVLQVAQNNQLMLHSGGSAGQDPEGRSPLDALPRRGHR